jgi:hypothetical protein
LSHYISNDYCNIEIRIFVPKKTLISSLVRVIRKNAKLEFAIKNIETLAQAGMTDGLVFEVWPNPQGVVGTCYNTKGAIIDDNLLETNGSKEYGLSKYQIDKTSDLRFIICIPILDQRGEVSAIMAFDSRHHITFNDEVKNRVSTSLITFSRLLYDSVPDLFKPIGGIL